MLFEFSLCPLEKVPPWGKSPNLTLSWFGLTLGFYRIQVGSEFLLNYSDELVAHWAKRSPSDYSGWLSPFGSFVDYQVVRLWEDTLSILPDVLEPLPTELSSLVEEDRTAWFSWESKALNWLDNQPDEDKAIDIFRLAISWQNARWLDTAYLLNGPRIWIWSTDQSVIISWDNTDLVLEGFQAWSAVQGHYFMERGEFLNEVRIFHEKLMLEMAERVESICAHWHRPEIYVDIENLKHQQQDRVTWLDQALKRSPSVSWDDVLSAISIISSSPL